MRANSIVAGALGRALRCFDSAKLVRNQGKKKPLQVFDLQGNN